MVCWHPPGSWRPLFGEILDPPLVSALYVGCLRIFVTKLIGLPKIYHVLARSLHLYNFTNSNGVFAYLHPSMIILQVFTLDSV